MSQHAKTRRKRVGDIIIRVFDVVTTGDGSSLSSKRLVGVVRPVCGDVGLVLLLLHGGGGDWVQEWRKYSVCVGSDHQRIVMRV